MIPRTRIHEDLACSWPSFNSSQVVICADNSINVLQRAPLEVRVADCDAPLFFKPCVSGGRRSAERELKAYTQIRQANPSQLRTSTLFSLVRDEFGWLLGLLLHYINCNSLTLQHAVTPEVSLSVRQYWAAEIDETLTRLHEIGNVLGDVKAANILVDAQDDPWIVDFGGSYTPGWVEKDLAGTVKGDEQGLSRIIDYICDKASQVWSFLHIFSSKSQCLSILACNQSSLGHIGLKSVRKQTDSIDGFHYRSSLQFPPIPRGTSRLSFPYQFTEISPSVHALLSPWSILHALQPRQDLWLTQN